MKMTTTLRMMLSVSRLPDYRADLRALEIDERALVVQLRAELAVARVGQVALRLHDLVVGRHADVELALDGLEPLFRQLARRLRRLHRLVRVANRERGGRHVRGDLQLGDLDLCEGLLAQDFLAGQVGLGGAGAERIGELETDVPRRGVEVADVRQRIAVAAGSG